MLLIILGYGKCLYTMLLILHGASDLDRRQLKDASFHTRACILGI